ncbi:hypothetical protein HMPREF9372_2732 [Sporosarcina newyorkensis 2681]|uniref:Uncharacterized protein n=1 Tax=Sporosarcina newyorkensis 2681 TaxID=1027292 RepID=F9DVA1_9BACL|nr:hypothetical protein HMPREF9372_2732 [Sporosarcina newyorkensis 2681]
MNIKFAKRLLMIKESNVIVKGICLKKAIISDIVNNELRMGAGR